MRRKHGFIALPILKHRVLPVYVMLAKKKLGQFGLPFRIKDSDDIGVRLADGSILTTKNYGKSWLAYDYDTGAFQHEVTHEANI